MTIELVKKQGQYLGFCDMKGYLYTVFRGYDNKGIKKYMIVSINNGDVSPLISYTGTL